MSRIFDSLRKAGGRAARAALPAIASAETSAPAARSGGPLDPGEAARGGETPVAQRRLTPGGVKPTIRTVKAGVESGSPVWPFEGHHPKAAEQYRIIRTKIVQHPLEPGLIAVASPGAGDGKTVSAINVAGSLALKSEIRVLLVDGDLRRGTCSGVLQIPSSPGLTDVLNGACEPEEAIVRIESLPNLYVLPAGTRTANPTELLDSSACRSLFETVRGWFRFTIIDGPPIGAVADYDIIQASCDGTIVVMRPDHTDRALGLQALQTVPQEKLVGVIVNYVEPWFLWPAKDYYYYQQSAEAGSQESAKA